MDSSPKYPNFLGIPEEFSRYQESHAVILPVPFDGTSTWLKGADRGPAALLEASQNIELYDIDSASEPYLQGIHTAPPLRCSDSGHLNLQVYTALSQLLVDEKFVVMIGGEHSISYGAVKACAEKWSRLSVLQLDAHADLRDEYQGNRFSHACIMARILEIVPHAVAVGIRSLDSSELSRVDLSRTFFAERTRFERTWIGQAVDLLQENVYLTIDLDVFDPGIMPSTGTPEPGGLEWYEVCELLRRLFSSRHVVACDLVELCPGAAKAPDFMAAKLVYKILSYKFARGRAQKPDRNHSARR